MNKQEKELLFGQLAMIHAKLDEVLSLMPERRSAKGPPRPPSRMRQARIAHRFDGRMLVTLKELLRIEKGRPIVAKDLQVLEREAAQSANQAAAEFYRKMAAAMEQTERKKDPRDENQ